MNRRGFFAALASLPFMPAAVKAAQARENNTLTVAKIRRAKAILMGFPDDRARYFADITKAINRRIDDDILKAFLQ